MLFEEKLIREIKKHDSIYNRKSGIFRSRAHRRNSWVQVSNAVKTPVKDCQARWKSLRDRYIKEISRQQLDGSDPNEPPTKWIFFESMSFLKDAIVPLRRRSLNPKGESNIVNEESSSSFLDIASSRGEQRVEYEDGEYISLDDNPLEVVPSPPHKREKLEDNHIDYGVVTGIERDIDRQTYEDRDENNPYLGVIGRLMQKVDAEQKDDLYMDIINYVHEKVKELNEYN